ncbi:MAG TPA: type II toxin-antitoxin system mRNA interferase toxin, RelE/StbE family [Spirochaetota bacterium]|jgi:addiction module RelE/StbE family toxin|nr:MAG: Plasmid encoded toxin Txe [Spirochaetes bacterium ADurb.Bin133]HNZ27386.1 type II toxin-antitoxin system mRNA interferase toxin, RelE/StbE family [Spirochaetota bacterium]HPY88760.1 type II toxin-antitoxin system mRNA interferase toxin, RelE/StbE family [Spirochaetota bacterium]
MIEIFWGDYFKKRYKKWFQKNQNLANIFEMRVTEFSTNPFNPVLKTHSLSGRLSGCWAFRINYKFRIIFRFLDENKTKVQLIDIGSHGEVY